jgi:hypothetical protein
VRVSGVIAIAVAIAAGQPKERDNQQERVAGLAEWLVREATLVRDGVIAPREDASGLAARMRSPVEPVFVLAALARPQHGDPFTDAYARWQLTGLCSLDAAAVAALDEKLTAQLFEHLPRPVENPRADPRLVARLERAAGAGPLSASDLERLRAELAAVEAAAAEAEALNRAALGFWSWLEAGLESSPGQRPAFLAARLGASAGAGWLAGRLKADLTRALTGGPAPAGPPRRRLEASIARLAGLERRVLEQVTFLADGSIRADFSTTGVGADDIERWLKLLSATP